MKCAARPVSVKADPKEPTTSKERGEGMASLVEVDREDSSAVPNPPGKRKGSPGNEGNQGAPPWQRWLDCGEPRPDRGEVSGGKQG